MNFLLTCALTVLTAFSFNLIALEDIRESPKLKLTYGVPHFPPSSIVDDKGFGGEDVELIRYIAQQLDIEIEFSACSWIRCLELAKAGKVDLLTSVSYTEERAQYLLYVHPPYKIGQITFLVRKGEAGYLAHLSDLSNKTIGKEKGAMYADEIDKNPDIKIYESAEAETLFAMLVSGRLDAVMGFDAVSEHMAENSKYKDLIEAADYRISVPPGHLAIAKRSGNALETFRLLEKQLQIMLTSGKLLEFINPNSG